MNFTIERKMQMKYVIEQPLSDLAIDVLLNATDYIGNCPRCFDASNHDLEMMRENEDFRAMVNGCLEEDDIDWDVNSQLMCADYVWGLYLQWSDGV